VDEVLLQGEDHLVELLHRGAHLVPGHELLEGVEDLDNDPQGIPASEMNRLGERAQVLSNGNYDIDLEVAHLYFLPFVFFPFISLSPNSLPLTI
jgi:hypothetical protein